MGLTEYSFGETNLWNVFWTHLTPKPAAKRSFPRNHGGSRIAWSRERKHDSASRLVPQREAPFILRGLGPPAHVRRGGDMFDLFKFFLFLQERVRAEAKAHQKHTSTVLHKPQKGSLQTRFVEHENRPSQERTPKWKWDLTYPSFLTLLWAFLAGKTRLLHTNCEIELIGGRLASSDHEGEVTRRNAGSSKSEWEYSIPLPGDIYI